jgi:hypothetical protein
MSSQFKITTWEGHDTMQLRTAISSLFLDKDDVEKLREHFRNESGKRNECDVVNDSKMKKLVPGVDIIVL